MLTGMECELLGLLPLHIIVLTITREAISVTASPSRLSRSSSRTRSAIDEIPNGGIYFESDNDTENPPHLPGLGPPPPPR